MPKDNRAYQKLLIDSEEGEILEKMQFELDAIKPTTWDISVETTSIDNLKRQIRHVIEDHLINLGYTLKNGEMFQDKVLSKDDLRTLQSWKRIENLHKNLKFLRKNALNLLNYVANGDEIDPVAIDPEIVPVKASSLEGDLFRFLSLYWSVPVSQGYGRRMRFLVRDRQNKKIIGLFALGDPVFNLRVRDQWIGWDVEQRRNMLRGVMDAFVLGSIPPYSQILGGKLVCVLITSEEVRHAYHEKYKNSISVISKRKHDNDLLLVTTTSALGKSSLYDRIKLGNRLFYIPIGATRGYGHFHIPQHLFQIMRKLLESIEHPYAKKNRFGHGPNWKMRVIRQALKECNLDKQLLRHSVSRDAYAIPLAENTRECLTDIKIKPRFYEGNVISLSRTALKRWIIPRSERKPEFKDFRNWQFLKSIIDGMGRVDDTQR